MAVPGIIFDIKKFAIHDGPGIRTTVFFKGCPLDCAWCHNPESRGPGAETLSCRRFRGSSAETTRPQVIGCEVSVETVMEEIRRDRIFYDESGGGVTFSGGEPMMQIDFLESLLSHCRADGLHTAVDTCGYADWEHFERIRELVDLFLYDLKLMDDGAHQVYTGVSNRLIHDNLQRLSEMGATIVVRIPMIPDVTDTSENLEAVAAFLRTLPSLRRIDLLPYNKLGEDKVERYNLQREKVYRTPQTTETMTAARRHLESGGFTVHVGG